MLQLPVLGTINADEAVTGLGGLRLFRGEVSIVVPGNSYTSNLESYLFAPVLRLADGNIVVLKLLAILGWAVGSVMLARAAHRVIGRAAGDLVGVLAWLCPGGLAVLSTRAFLAYPWGLAVVATTIYLLFGLAGSPPTWRASLVVGLAGGLALYLHPMYLMILGPLAVTAMWPFRRAVRDWWVPAGLGVVAANLPFLAWNLLNDFPSVRDPATFEGTYGGRLVHFFTELLPVGFGLRGPGFRSPGDYALGRVAGPVLALVLVAVCIVGCRRLWSRGASERAVVVSLIAVWPLMAMLSALGFTADGRYAIIPLPALLIAFAAGVEALAGASFGPIRWPVAAGWVALLVVPVAVDSWGTVRARPARPVEAVVARLDEARVGAVAGGYWEVLPVMYASGASIEGAVLYEGPIRYPESQRSTQERDHADVAFIFRPDNEDVSRLWLPADRYSREILAGFVVYLPKPVS